MSNIAQLIITLAITIFLTKFLGISIYGEYTVLISSIILISLIFDPVLNPYFLREASKEINLTSLVSNCLTIVIIYFFFILLIILIFSKFLPISDKIYELNIFFNFFFIVASLFILNICKILNRITENFGSYSFITIGEKFILFLSILISNLFFNNEIIKYSIILYSFFLFFFSFVNIKIILRLFKISTVKKKDLETFYKSVSVVYISTIIYYFISYEYLIIHLSNNKLNEIIIGTIGLAFFLSNAIYFFIFWGEQTFSQKIIFLIDNSKNKSRTIKDYLNNYFEMNLSIIFLILSCFIFIIINTDILVLIDKELLKYKSFFTIILFLTFSKSLDTLIGIINNGLRIEKYTIPIHAFRLIILLTLYYFTENLKILIIAYILLTYIQNTYFLVIIYQKARVLSVIFILYLVLILSLLMVYNLNFILVSNIILIMIILLTSINIYKYKDNALNYLRNSIE